MWVFGYGSLMWNPGFPVEERRPAFLRGYHRAYMMYSTRNRGTPDCPGVVLSLAPGGECVGMALRVEPGHEAEAIAYLDKREGVGRAHRRVMMPVHWYPDSLAPAHHVWTYLPILTYSNYIWGVPLERQAELVACGCGSTGTSFDYLRLLLDELGELGVSEPRLERLFAAAREHLEAGRPLRLLPPDPPSAPADPPAPAGRGAASAGASTAAPRTLAAQPAAD